MLTLKVAGQIIKPVCCDTLVSDSLNILEIQFVFDAAWEGLAKTAQFTQVNKDGSTGETFNVLLDEFGTVMLPNEIHQGVVNISVFGVKDNRRLTTAPLAVPVVESGFIGKTLLIPTPEIYMQIMNTIAPNKAAYDAMTAELQKAILNAYQKTQMAVNEADARLEAIIQAAGDLDGDAELLDIRLGENGENYSTAGTAVREQFRKQREELIRKLTTPFSITGAVAACHPVGGYPLEVISHIEPVQDGSGDPSPSRDKIQLAQTGVNLLTEKPHEIGIASSQVGYYVGCTSFVARVKPGTKLIARRLKTSTGNRFGVALTEKQFMIGDAIERPSDMPAIVFGNPSDNVTEIEFTVPDGYNWLYLYVDNARTYPSVDGYCVTDVATEFMPNTSKTIEVSLGATVYGGEYNWKTGILTITHALDDKQAVTALSVPEKIQLTPQQILPLDGANALWSDCGETTVNGPTDPKYRDEMQDKRIAALEAAMLNA